MKFAQGLLFASVASLVVACAADEEPRVEVGPADDTADMISSAAFDITDKDGYTFTVDFVGHGGADGPSHDVSDAGPGSTYFDDNLSVTGTLTNTTEGRNAPLVSVGAIDFYAVDYDSDADINCPVRVSAEFGQHGRLGCTLGIGTLHFDSDDPRTLGPGESLDFALHSSDQRTEEIPESEVDARMAFVDEIDLVVPTSSGEADWYSGVYTNITLDADDQPASDFFEEVSAAQTTETSDRLGDNYPSADADPNFGERDVSRVLSANSMLIWVNGDVVPGECLRDAVPWSDGEEFDTARADLAVGTCLHDQGWQSVTPIVMATEELGALVDGEDFTLSAVRDIDFCDGVLEWGENWHFPESLTPTVDPKVRTKVVASGSDNMLSADDTYVCIGYR